MNETFIGAGELVLDLSADGEPTFPQGILKGYFAMKKYSPTYLPVYLMAVKLQKARRIKKPHAFYTARKLPTNGEMYEDDLARWHNDHYPNRREVSNTISVDCPDFTSAFVRYILEGEVKEADFEAEGGFIILPKGARVIRAVFKEEETPGCAACAGKMTRHIVGCPKRSKK